MRCALFVSGQLAKDEVADLKAHVAGCDACRRSIEEMADIGSSLLLKQNARGGRFSAPKGMQERFVARAIWEGVPLRKVSRKASLRLHEWALAVAALLFFVFSASVFKTRFYPDIAVPVTSVAVRPLPTQIQASPTAAREVRASRSLLQKRMVLRGGRTFSSSVGHRVPSGAFREDPPRFTLYSPKVDGFDTSGISLPKISRLSSEYRMPGLGLRPGGDRIFRPTQLWREDGALGQERVLRYRTHVDAKVASLLSLELPKSGALQEMHFSHAVLSPRSSVSQ